MDDSLIVSLRNQNNLKDSRRNTPYFHGFYLGRTGSLFSTIYDRDYFLNRGVWGDGMFDMGVEDGIASLKELPYPTPNIGDD